MFRRRTMIGAIAIAVVVVLSYWPSMRGGFQWDDDDLVTENALVKAPDGLARIWFSTEAIDYWPVTNSSFWIEWRLWGTDPTGYHVTNVALHIASALCVWMVLRRLSIPGSFLAALLFAVHPINVESVAWIAQRKNTLAMLFFGLSIWWYLKQDRAKPRSTAYWLSVAAFVLAMLSKGSVAVLPVVLLLVEWWRKDEVDRRDLRHVVPFFIVSGVLTVVTLWFRTHGAAEAFRNATLAERLAGAGAVTWFYLYKAVLPIHLTFVYPLWKIDVSALWWWLPLLGAIGLTALLWLGRERAWCRAALFAWAYFAVCLLPVMGFTDAYYVKYSLVADHYQYLSIVGVCALAAAGIDRLGAWLVSSVSK